MKQNITFEEALNKLEVYCASSEKCTEDVSRKMEAWELSDEEKDRLIDQLTKNQFLDEERFAKAYVNDKYKFSKWGKRKIIQNMLMKGVENNAIRIGISVIDMNLYFENLHNLLLNKQSSVKASDEYELKNKLIRFAMGRGYDYADIIKVMPNLEVF